MGVPPPPSISDVIDEWSLIDPMFLGDPELLQRRHQLEEARPAPLPNDCCSSSESTDTASPVFEAAADYGCSKSPSPKLEKGRLPHHHRVRVRPESGLNSVLTKVQCEGGQKEDEERTRRQSDFADESVNIRT